MADLDTLRPEVREALEVCDRDLPETWHSQTTQWGVIRAELVRLARENAELRRAWDDALLTGTGILKVERVDPATVMLPVAPRQGKGTPVPQSEHEALTERAERTEAELAALKARIAEAARAYHSSFEYTLDASTLYARATGIPGEETYALVKVED